MALFSRLLDRFTLEEYKLPPGGISFLRIVYASFVLLVVGVPQYRWIANRPDFFYDPPQYSVAAWFDAFPSEAFFISLDILLIGCFVFLLFGLYTRWVSLLTGTLMLIGFSFYYSFGKINHDALLMLYVPVVMSFSNWGHHFSLDARRKAHRSDSVEQHWPLAFLALLLGFAMFSAGVPKLISGWLSTSTQAVRGFVVMFNYDDNFPERFLQPWLLAYDNSLFWEVLDYSAVFFEIGFLVSVLNRRVFRGFITAAVTFHTVNILIFSISFVNNLALYLLFINWKGAIDYLTNRDIDRFLKKRILFTLLLLMIGGYFLNISFSIVGIATLLGMHFLTISLLISLAATVLFVINYWNDLTKKRSAVAQVRHV